jgi:hypothetical protein
VLPEPDTCNVSFTAQEKGAHTVHSLVEGKPLPPVEVLVLPKGEMLGARQRYVEGSAGYCWLMNGCLICFSGYWGLGFWIWME